MGEMPSPTSAGEDRPRGPSSRLTGRRPRLIYGIAAAALLVAGVALAIARSGHGRGHGSASSGPALGLAGLARLPACGAECDPIDPRYLTDMRFGRSSFWIQPWRAYLDTWPAARLRAALGINFNVKPTRAPAVARLLHDSGFTLARIGIDWDSISYRDPTRFTNEANVRAKLSALHAYGLRPLIVLDSNSVAPCPVKPVDLETVSPAPAGATTVTLSPASAAAVAPGRSGFNAGVFFPHAPRRRRPRGAAPASIPPLTPAQRLARRATRRAERRQALAAGRTPLVLHGSPGILITKVAGGGVATLSRPLPAPLPAGSHNGTTLLYAPFAAPKLPDGAPNPSFQATMRGWLSYVAAVAREARSIVGAGGYDLEIWNELTFGSEFLNAANYFPHASTAAGRKATEAVTISVIRALLYDTVAYIRNPANGIPSGVGISDGFASQTPLNGGALAPQGLTALSKHPYVNVRNFPAEYKLTTIRPIDALGAADTTSRRSFAPRFVPNYQTLLPEYTLTATSTTTLIHDLAPITTRIASAPHGRSVGPRGGQPLQKWITEYNLAPGNAAVMGPDEITPQTGAAATLGRADREHFHAKALLRSLVAMVGKGVSREYFFAAAPGALSLVGERFYAALEVHPHSYPPDELGGETLSGLRDMLARFEGPGPGGPPRQLKLLAIAQDGNHAQFKGDGTAAHPDLYDREVLAVLPFQSSPTRYVIPVYVMTSNLLTLYQPGASRGDIHRFDLPQETFRVTLGNLPETARPPAVSAFDPLSDRATTARLRSRRGDTAVFELVATDYPRLLTVDYRASS
jgi:hypothetical protein